MKTTAIVQARMGSSRLPAKVMSMLADKTVLAHDIERIKQMKEIDEIIIATTTNSTDDVIAEEASKNGAKVFRGSESDVLSRYYYAAKESGSDIVVRITSDCPLIDPFVGDEILKFYKSNNYDVVTNGGADPERTYPRGLDIEVFSFRVLELAQNNADKPHQREHVTPYMYENDFPVHYYKNNINLSKYRWTLDTPEDYELISKIYEHLYKGNHDFYMDDIVAVFEQHPELYDINAKIIQKKY